MASEAGEQIDLDFLDIDESKKSQILLNIALRNNNKPNNKYVIGYYDYYTGLHKGYVFNQLQKINDLGFNVDTNVSEYKELYQVTTNPTFLIIKNNKLLEKLEGKYMNNTLIKKLYEIGWL